MVRARDWALGLGVILSIDQNWEIVVSSNQCQES